MQFFQKWLKLFVIGMVVFAGSGRSARANEHPELDKLFATLFTMMDRCLGYCHFDFDQDFTLIEVAKGFEPELVGRDRIIVELNETIEFFLSLMDEVAPEERDAFHDEIYTHYDQAVIEFSQILGDGSYQFYKNQRSFRNNYDRWQLYFVGENYRLKIEYGSGR